MDRTYTSRREVTDWPAGVHVSSVLMQRFPGDRQNVQIATGD